ncbi:MAG: hypothetical protein CMD02_07330 [Flavobacteriales bacterium]|nr:hypothetical protein [Flavobacteriales bacterium]|tara:strand:- start:8490 stop:9053 length:564 start_codon:yes stop_codon:yes gene_type:complete
MKKLIVVLFILILVLSLFFYKKKYEYYIPKPEALVKIELPDSRISLFKDEKISFNYSNSSVVSVKDNFYSIEYPDYSSSISFRISPLLDFDLELYNFENSISIHEKQGANINANIIQDTSENIYGVLCYLVGNNIATSSQFFVTDSADFFVRGGLDFECAISSEIEVQNIIMKQEILKFIQSLRWVD